MKNTDLVDPTPRPVYCFVGDYVYSADGDRHYIPARELPRLYRLSFTRRDYFLDYRDPYTRIEIERLKRLGVVILWPDSSGNYKL